MTFAVHRNERSQLQESRIDHAADAFVLEANTLDHRFLELAHGHPCTEIGHVCRGCIGVDRAADQGQRARLRVRVQFGQIGRGSKGQRHRLAHGDDICVGAKLAHELHQVEGVILDIELAGADGNVAGVVPICHVNFAVHD